MTVVPLVRYLSLDEPPHLVGQRCVACGEVFLDRRNGCGRCGGETFEATPLARRGTILSFTEVHRGVPWVPTPYVPVTVALEGGGVARATLRNAPPATRIPLGAAVELVTYPVGEDEAGNTAIGFGFELVEEVCR